MRSAWWLAARRGVLAIGLPALLLLHGCASLPPPAAAQVPVKALQDTADTPLARVWQRAPATLPADVNAAVHPLTEAPDAFVARVLLVRAAQRSVDVQYYIWRDDVTGRLLWRELKLAAERGVRVRLLLDDINTKGLDETLSALDALPNLEVRLFNPFANRAMRWVDFVGDFSRVNRRMHNKSLTADNQATIVGGRNVGNEYFGAGGGTEFRDLDVLAFGPLVREVSASFDAYWNAASSYPLARLVPPADDEAKRRVFARLDATLDEPDASSYQQRLKQTPLVTQIVEGAVALHWVPGRVVADPPGKIDEEGGATPENLMAQLGQTVGVPRGSFDLVSPYFVPGKRGTQGLVDLASSGVQVRVLTNSLLATDVAPVHAGYAKRRQALVAGGIRLYELKPDATTEAKGSGSGTGGSSDASLHAKTFAIDGEALFVGSFNFDPRSVALNTEMGVVLRSRELAGGVTRAFEEGIPRHAYEVRRADDGSLVWVERTPDGERHYRRDPGAGVLKLLTVDLLSVLPIEWLL